MLDIKQLVAVLFEVTNEAGVILASAAVVLVAINRVCAMLDTEYSVALMFVATYAVGVALETRDAVGIVSEMAFAVVGFEFPFS